MISIPVGIDIAKDRYDVMIHPHDREPFHEKHHGPGSIAAVVAMIAAHVPAGTPAIIGLEYTGGMALRLLEALERTPAYDLQIISDTDVAALRRVLNRPRKTDKLDADLIMRAMVLARDPNSADVIGHFLTPWANIRVPLRARQAVRHVTSQVEAQRSAKLRLQRAELPIQFSHHTATIAHHRNQITEGKAAIIAEATTPHHLLLQTIPGITAYRSAVFMAAIGDIARFPSPDALVRYLGLMPPPRPTSGGTKQTGAARHHRASTLLDTELFMWSMSIAQRPQAFHGFAYTYETAKANRDSAGKRGRSPQWTVQRKLIRLIWHKLTTNQPFDPLRTYPPGVPPVPMPKPDRTRKKPTADQPDARTEDETLVARNP